MGGLSTETAAQVADEVADEVLLARAFLSRVGEPCNIPMWAFVRKAGAVDAARAIAAGRAPEEVQKHAAPRLAEADPWADLETAAALGVRLVVPESDRWPHFGLACLEFAAEVRLGTYRAGRRSHENYGEPIPPLALWAKGPGDPSTLGHRTVGMVGSRACTQYGEHVATQWSYELAQQGVTVISGGAYGIDACAHRGALAAEGDTVLISAAGLDRPYPPGNARLFDRVAERGLLISEGPPGMAPHRHRFLMRNRLIAALSSGTVIVEAARRSGAANTASHCQRLGRPLMAVPGPVTSAMSAGCHELIRRESDPALLVASSAEILAVVGSPGEGMPDPGDARTTDIRAELDRLDPAARRVFEGLTAGKFSRPDEIALRAGIAPLEVFRALPTLELADLVEVGEAGYRVAARVRDELK